MHRSRVRAHTEHSRTARHYPRERDRWAQPPAVCPSWHASCATHWTRAGPNGHPAARPQHETTPPIGPCQGQSCTGPLPFWGDALWSGTCHLDRGRGPNLAQTRRFHLGPMCLINANEEVGARASKSQAEIGISLARDLTSTRPCVVGGVAADTHLPRAFSELNRRLD